MVSILKLAENVIGQMDRIQNEAETNILVLSPEYLSSHNCQHEMQRACARDPNFTNGSIIPVLRADCNLPDIIKRGNPLWIDLRNDNDASQWALLLQSCHAHLGTPAPDWLKVKDDIILSLHRGQSINLVLHRKVEWRSMISQIAEQFDSMGIVDLDSPATVPREGLIAEILRSFRLPIDTLSRPADLLALNAIAERKAGGILVLLHFDNVTHADRNYGPDFISSLRYLITDRRKLVLMIISHQPFDTLSTGKLLLPSDYNLSPIPFKLIEL